MDIGSLNSGMIEAFGVKGSPQISSERVDANGMKLSMGEKGTLTSVAKLQGETVQHTYTRYGLTKAASESGLGVSLMSMDVHSVEEFVEALKKQAEENGGYDQYGVSASEYGRLIDTIA